MLSSWMRMAGTASTYLEHVEPGPKQQIAELDGLLLDRLGGNGDRHLSVVDCIRGPDQGNRVLRRRGGVEMC